MNIMNNKGFSIIELMIITAIIMILGSIIVPNIIQWASDEKIAQKTGSLVKEFKQEAQPEVKIKTVTINRSGIKCIDGRQAIEVDGKIYYIGELDSWDDIKSIECK